MFPIWINDGKSEMPTDPIFYVIAKDGIYLKKTLGDFDTMNKVNNISILGECKSYAFLNIAKIKVKQFAKVLSLFKEVYQIYHSEANIILHYNKKKKRYKIDVPKQGVSAAGVDYNNGEHTYKDYIRIGTIHSHANMSAFHSGIDQDDEANWDGLHITLGKMDEKYFDISCSIMSGSERFMVQPQDYIEGIELVEYQENSPYGGFEWINNKYVKTTSRKKLGYKINVQEKDFKFPKTWLTKIDRPEYTKPNNIPSNIMGFEDFYNRNKRFNVTPQQQNLFDNIYEVDENDWNPCLECPYRNHKSDLMLKDLINNLDDETAKRLGITNKNQTDPFYVNDENKDNLK